jgi:hypothetical protein
MVCWWLGGCVKTGNTQDNEKFCVQSYPKEATVYVNNVQVTTCQKFPLGAHIHVSAHADGFHNFEHSFIFHGSMTYEIYMEPMLSDEHILE